jgi:predicted nuclease of predicted toxin-antitoxin system
LRLLADENVHPLIIQRLRDREFQVEWIKESSRGARDEDILLRNDIDQLVLITLDRDFGDLIFVRDFPAPLAIIYSRLSRAAPHVIADRILELIERGVRRHHITTITPQGERVKAFPGV